MKVYDLLVTEVAMAVREIFVLGSRASKVIEKSLKSHPKWGARDRRFFAESVYEMVRWWRYLWWLCGEEASSTDVQDLKSLWAVWWFWQKDEIQSEHLKINPNDILTRLKLVPPRAVLESIPDWLDQKGEDELGNRWPSIMHSLNEKAPVFLRVNTLKTNVENLQKTLLAEQVASEIFSKETLKLVERKNVFVTKAFKEGLFELQDWSSQQVGPFLRVEPGMRVIDACAGAGGKSLHLAALMKNKGRVISLDIYEWKLNELRVRSRRNQIDIIEARLIEGQKTIKRLEGSADRLLLDVPCSGIGVIRRNPDAKWKLSLAELENLRALQTEILSTYGRMLKSNGIMVYSTCSVLPSENELQIAHFLQSPIGQNWELIEQKRIDPDCGEAGDGFYMAALKKKASLLAGGG